MRVEPPNNAYHSSKIDTHAIIFYMKEMGKRELNVKWFRQNVTLLLPLGKIESSIAVIKFHSANAKKKHPAMEFLLFCLNTL